MLSIKKKLGATIYQKIFSLLIFSSVIFISLFFAILYYLAQQKRDIHQKTQKQFDKTINAVIKLDAKNNISNIIDMAYWDDLKNYVITKNNDWFQSNIVTSLQTYNADYLGIYDVNGNFVSKHSNNKIQAVDFIPKPVFKKLLSKRVLKFYLMLPEGMLEVYGATIHPSADIDSKVTRASGYFFIVRRYDQNYLKSLEAVSNSKIGFQNKQPQFSEKSIVTSKVLPTWDNRILSQVYFERPFAVSFYMMESIVYILIFTFLLSIIVNLTCSHLWIYKPLKLVVNMLENGNEKDVRLLNNVPREFKHISFLIKENDIQKKLLVKAKAKAEESDKLKSSFLTNISHEIRTPINAINGFSDLLTSELLTADEYREYTQIIKQSGINLVSIIDDLLEMSKIDSNLVVSNFTLVNLDTALHNLHKAIQVTIPKDKPIELILLAPINPIEPNIVTDKIKLLQILTNLITNGIKYSEKGKVTFGYDYHSDGQLYFTVKDSGIGIDKEQHALIFNRFHRVDNDFAIKAGGLGLGLAISKAYVEMLGGHIALKSKANMGTTFSFTITPQVALVIPSHADKIADNLEAVNVPLLILVAEDNDINYLLLKKILSMKLHTVLRARDGAEAVAQCRDNNQIDLVLMDIKMPVMDGYQAFENIKLFRPALPMIAQTAFSSTEEQLKIMAAGFHGYLLKPIDKQQLIEALNNVIKLKNNR